jgi:hypothetical protein
VIPKHVAATQDASGVQPSEHDPRRELVARVLVSAAFARSKRLSALLSYVCDLALSGRANEINEQRLGEAVFGRSGDYDAAIDGIVRTQASRLRQRLDQYFKEDGAGEPLTIVIPRGSYIPLFEPRFLMDIPQTQQLSPIGDVVESTAWKVSAAVAPGSSPRLWRPLVASWCLITILAFVAVHYWWKSVQMRPPAPVAHPLFSNLFLPGQKTLVVPEDNGMVIWQGLMKQNLSLDEYLEGKYRVENSEVTDPKEKLAISLGDHRYTNIVALEVVQSLSHIADSEGGSMEVRYARDVRPNDLRDNNVVLIGAPEANPWVELFEPGMNFVFFMDRPHNIFSIVNRHPHGNEPKEWVWIAKPNNLVYAIVDYLPGLNGKRNALILAGTAMAGTECALNFILDDKQISPFLKQIRRADGTLPHFEVVLGSPAMSQDALKPNILAWRVID